MNDKVSIYDHVNKFKSLLMDLMGVSIKIDEEEETTLFLYSMSSSWYNLIMTLSHVP